MYSGSRERLRGIVRWLPAPNGLVAWARPVDNHVTADDPGFEDAAKGRFGLRAGAAAFDRLSFAPIPFDRIGLRTDAYRRQVPAIAAEEP